MQGAWLKLEFLERVRRSLLEPCRRVAFYSALRPHFEDAKLLTLRGSVELQITTLLSVTQSFPGDTVAAKERQELP